MTTPTLTECRSPWVVFTRSDDPWVSSEAAKLQQQGGRVFRLAGRELREPASLFTAFARELSFPNYFGLNWDALVDGLHDWHGHGSDTKDIALEVLPAHPARIWERGDVLVCMREINTIAVVSPADATVRWWWGPDELSGPHQPTMLPDGNILVFDNGRDHRRTRLVIIDPASSRITWSWTADPPESFFCPLAGGCQPLPNGNLLVTNSTAGAAFELTPSGRTVWDLVLPVNVYGADRAECPSTGWRPSPPQALRPGMHHPDSPSREQHHEDLDDHEKSDGRPGQGQGYQAARSACSRSLAACPPTATR